MIAFAQVFGRLITGRPTRRGDRRPHGPSLDAKILNYFSIHGLHPTIVQQVSDLMPTLALVAAGLRSTFVPSAMARHLSLRDVALVKVGKVPT